MTDKLETVADLPERKVVHGDLTHSSMEAFFNDSSGWSISAILDLWLQFLLRHWDVECLALQSFEEVELELSRFLLPHYFLFVKVFDHGNSLLDQEEVFRNDYERYPRLDPCLVFLSLSQDGVHLLCDLLLDCSAICLEHLQLVIRLVKHVLAVLNDMVLLFQNSEELLLAFLAFLR